MPDQVMYATTLEWTGDLLGDRTIKQDAVAAAEKHGVTLKDISPNNYNWGVYDVLFTSPDRDRLKALYLDEGPGDWDESFVVQVLALDLHLRAPRPVPDAESFRFLPPVAQPHEEGVHVNWPLAAVYIASLATLAFAAWLGIRP